VLIDTGRRLDLSLDEESDPVEAGAELTYTLTFGNRSAALAPNAVIQMPLPVGTTFMSASDDGMLDGDVVRWPLNTLSPGESGIRLLTVQFDDTLVDGDIVRSSARILDTSNPPSIARATAGTRVEAAVPVLLGLSVSPDPVLANHSATVILNAANTGPVATGLALRLIVPPEVPGFFSNLTSGGACTSNFCDTGESIAWDVANFLPDSEVDFTVTPPIRAGTPAGSVVSFDARLTESFGTHVRFQRSIRVGTP
jgi:uncharacterized repeat protein (TIGR01451 family)